MKPPFETPHPPVQFRSRPPSSTLQDPEAFAWRAVAWWRGRPCRWVLDDDAELGVLPHERDHAYLRSEGKTHIWHDTSPQELALQVELGFMVEPDEVIDSGAGARTALQLLPGGSSDAHDH